MNFSRKWAQYPYNTKHRHSALKYVTPEQRHTGQDVALLEQREKLYEAAKRNNPERWSGKTRDWTHNNIVKLNPVNETGSGGSNNKQQAA